MSELRKKNDEPRTHSAHVLLDSCWSILVSTYGAWAEAAVPPETLERLASLPHAIACRDAVKMLAITPELAARVCRFVVPVDKQEKNVLSLACASGYQEP